jgi:hypothetical protein
MRKLLTPFFVVFLMAGCASGELLKEAETPEQKYWAALNIFDAYDEAALTIAQDPNTPVTIKQTLKRARSVAKEALELANISYDILQDARIDLANIPNESNLDKLSSALRHFNFNSERAFDQVNAFKYAIDNIQE